MKALLLTLLAVLLLTSTPAHAIDNGFYGGATVGVSRTDLDLEAAPPGSTAAIFDQAEFDTLEYGALAGYHQNFARNFFLETELDFVFAEGDEDNLFGTPLATEKNHSYAINFKPGYQWNNDWGAFLVLGWQWVEYESSFAPSGFSGKDTGHGLNHGLGVNYTISDRVSLTGEYVRVQTTDVAFEHNPGALASRFDPELDTVKVALRYHF